jgi:deoxyribonuclease (pyrimidine dimer)
MTRVNVVPPRELHGKHLLAEYREIPRIPTTVRKHQLKGRVPGDFKIPPEYKLGTGHVTFFYNKLGFIQQRFNQLVQECKRRGYDIQYTEMPLDDIDQHWLGYYHVTDDALRINRERILQRMSK